MRQEREKEKYRGSIFGKLIGSYVIFSLIAITITLASLLLFFTFSSSRIPLQNFPGITFKEDGSIEYLEEVSHLGGWVEELDKDFHVTEVFGEKQTKNRSYTPEELISITAFLEDGRTKNFGRDALVTIHNDSRGNPAEEYHVFWQKKEGGYYLMFYPLDSFSIVYNMNLNRAVISNVTGGELFAVLVLLLLDVFGVSFYIFRKIKRPLDNLIQGMNRVEQGEEQVELSMHREREFVEIGEAFNRMTEQLHMQRAENEKMGKSRQKMLLELSHDIKTPVATIKSCACALEEGMVPKEELPRYYHTIALKAERVNTMSEDLFTMLKMESADYQPKLKPLNLAELARRICGEYYGEIREEGFAFEIEIPQEPVYVLGDEELLARVIGNLLTNAKKYNERGEEIKIILKAGEQVSLKVEDDGEEISKDVQGTMFHAFVRGEKDRNSRGGTGLGLAIAKAVMEKHNGGIFYKRVGEKNMFELVFNFLIW